MKKILIILLIVVDISIIFVYYSLDVKYGDREQLLLEKIDNSSYEETINEMNTEYNKILDDISLLVDKNMDDVSILKSMIAELNDKYDELVIASEELVNKEEKLTKQKATLTKTYNQILEEEKKKNTFIISGVPKINQYSLGYPTGCESAALTNLLNYWNVSVKMSSVVKKLPKGKLPYYENNIKYGGNPYLEFVGNPNSYSSYGVYEKPILQVAESFKSGVINGTGMSLDNVLEIVGQNRPVMVWVSMNMSVPYVSTSWIYKPTGEKIKWLSGEHALVVIGYNQNQVIVSDSLNGAVRYYDKNVFESRYNTFGKRAVYY